MDIIRAKEILEILADGVNPLTGEVLPDRDSCNQLEQVRAEKSAKRGGFAKKILLKEVVERE